nr:DUF1694 domain-containing protein [uncultured Cetobacterium sp.]
MVENIINEREKAKLKFLKSQSEKLFYLGEFKENIIVALEKDEIEKSLIHEEVVDAMKDPTAILLKLRRDIKLENLKFYINAAEKIGLRYMLVDDLTFRGNIGLVVVSSEDFDNDDKNVILESATKVYVNAGLSPGFAYAVGKKICPKHYKELKNKLPEYLDKFQEMTIFDRLFGKVCEIDRYEEKER